MEIYTMNSMQLAKEPLVASHVILCFLSLTIPTLAPFF